MQFTSEETQEILSRVSTSEVPHQSEGALTLSELQRIGKELGLDPDEIARAAARYRSEDVEVVRTNLVDFEFIRAIPQPLNRLGWGFLVDSVRIASQVDGESRVMADGSLQWWGSTGSEDITLTLRNEQRSLTLRVARRDKGRLGNAAGGFVGVLLLVFVLSAGRFDLKVAGLMALVLFCFAAVTFAYIAASTKRPHQLSDALGEELAGVISSKQFAE